VSAALVEGTGIVPERVSDPAEAFRLLQIDGASILSVGETSPQAAVEATEAVLGEHLRSYRPPMGIVTNPVDGEGPHPDAERRNVLADRSVELELHIDGYMMFGTAYPDFIFLLCVEQAPQGGDSYVVDGVRLADRIAADPAERELARFLWERPIDQSTPTGVAHHSPVVSWTPGGRRTARGHGNQRVLPGSPPRDQELLDRWRALCLDAARQAPRFRMQPGDFFCLDNYRLFHGRTPYAGTGRTLHRIWSWSEFAFGVPAPETNGPRPLVRVPHSFDTPTEVAR